LELFGYTIAYPYILAALILLPFMGLWYWLSGKKKKQSITFSNLSAVAKKRKSLRELLAGSPNVLRLLALAALIFALARPQTFSTGENVYVEGIDIALILDVSSSMLAQDFKPSRIDAAKKITENFINARTSDNIGLVVFARVAFTQCPLTIDYRILRERLQDVQSGVLEDGTAIGNAIANAVNRLKDSKANSKVMILLTDGVNNAGEVDPVTAAEIAQLYNIRIYTIGVGTRGEAPYPVQTPFGIQYQNAKVEIDEETLQEIAGITGGKYFRATNNRKLEEIFDDIDRLEKTRVEVTSYRTKTEHFFPFLLGGALLLLLELILSRTIFRKLP
jgi:Ca-activated chloride channel family protein